MTEQNDQTVVDEIDETEVPADELTSLKKRADTMGLKYHPNIGLDALKAKVLAAQSETESSSEVTNNTTQIDPVLADKIATRKSLRDDAMKLVRLRIANLNPTKADMHGEIFTVANEIVGIVKKFIPYGEATEDGFHVPNILYKQLKTRKFLQVKTKKNPRDPRNDMVEQRWVPEFALEVLPQLTPEELAQLAKVQAASGGVA